jgi:hypothetical protein
MRAKNKKTKPRGKARATAKRRAAKKPVAKKAKAATPAKAPKAKRKPVKPRRTKGKVGASPPGVSDRDAIEGPALAVDATLDDSSGAAKKPGTLARLKSGVGSLFAKMTGRGTKTESDGVPRDDATMEIVTADIILQGDAPSLTPPSAKRDRKPKPPPPSPTETSED